MGATTVVEDDTRVWNESFFSEVEEAETKVEEEDEAI